MAAGLMALAALGGMRAPQQATSPTQDRPDQGAACYAMNMFPAADFGRTALSAPQSIGGPLGPFGRAEPLGSYHGPQREWARAVGRLDVVLSSGCMQTCTATLLPGGHIITAGHCFLNADQRARRARVVFDHMSSGDVEKPSFDVDLASVKAFDPVPNRQGDMLKPDIVIARLTSVPSRPTALLSPDLPADGAGLVLIHHPRGQAMHATRGGCRVSGNDGVGVLHQCDTVAGSSGAPMFEEGSGRIIGIHAEGGLNASPETANRGYAVGPLTEQIRLGYGDAFLGAPIPPASGTGPAPLNVADQMQQGRAALSANRYLDAYSHFKAASDAGDGMGAFEVGEMLTRGEGLPRDEAGAFTYYRLAAERGVREALIKVGEAYWHGGAVEPNEAEAVIWLRRAADAGDVDARRLLGHAYMYGRGVAEDRSQGLAWFRLAAEQGDIDAADRLVFHLRMSRDPSERAQATPWIVRGAEAGRPESMFALSSLYLFGDGGMSRDAPQGVAWLTKAADLGYSPALVELGDLYATGREVVRDRGRAETYYRRAVDLKDEEAGVALADLLSADATTEAERVEAFNLYHEGAISLWKRVRQRAYAGLAKAHHEGAGTSRADGPALAYAVMTLELEIGSTRAVDADHWAMFRAIRATASAEVQAEVRTVICESDAPLETEDRFLVDCAATPPVWRSIANSSAPPNW